MAQGQMNARERRERRLDEIERTFQAEDQRMAQRIDCALSARAQAALVDEAVHLYAVSQAEPLTLTPEERQAAGALVDLVKVEVEHLAPGALMQRVQDARAKGDLVELALIGMFATDPYIKAVARQPPRLGEMAKQCEQVRGLWASIRQGNAQAWTDARRLVETRAIDSRARDLYERELRTAL